MRIILAAAFVSLSVASVMAQTPAPRTNPYPNTPAVVTPRTPTPAQPAAGANSFTEAQAKSRIESNGYSAVSGLAKDKDGVWRGKATKGGVTHEVALDYQGNVTAK